MVSNNGAKTGKLAKLTQLEAELTKLSEQVKSNKKTIILLKKSLTERDLKIHELESKLIYAQQSLLKKATFTIHQCRDQIKNGIDEKIINPVLSQIQQQIEVIQGIVYEAKDLINKKKVLIQENINATSNLVHQCPDQAVRYFERTVVEPARSLVTEVVELVDSKVKTGQDLVVQKIIYPGKVWYDNIVAVAQALPTQSQVIFQVWLAEPVMQKVKALPVIGKELGVHADLILKSLMGRLKSGAEQGLAYTVDAIKKSPFWDGKRNIEAA
ncbi:hypothetical protein [Methylobacter svalbardensis]|uniref:hypothetical protein n=1 Tax=Methylobacter svalbardensis TaxID=3080016 RepID=UPI0030EF79B6